MWCGMLLVSPSRLLTYHIERITVLITDCVSTNCSTFEGDRVIEGRIKSSREMKHLLLTTIELLRKYCGTEQELSLSDKSSGKDNGLLSILQKR